MTYVRSADPPVDKLARAKDLRNRPTRSEERLWEQLKGRQLGRPFLRQWLILGYIVDFYSPPSGLVVEVDGWDKRRTAYGRNRDRVLQRAGFEVVHVPAHAILHDMDGVLALIRRTMYR